MSKTPDPKDQWAKNVLEAFHITHIPGTPASRLSVAKYILGQMGQSRKPPGERASYYQAACTKYVGKRVRQNNRDATVLYLLVRNAGSRVNARPSSYGYVGPFAAYLEFDSGYRTLAGLSTFELIDEPQTPA